MTQEQSARIDELLLKYNDVLLNSMRLALTEDLIGLIILNREDENFELSELLKDKTTLSNYVTGRFLKQNSGGVLHDLGKFEDPLPGLKERFGNPQRKMKFGKK